MIDSSSITSEYNPVSDARRYVQNAKDILNEKADLNPEPSIIVKKNMSEWQGIPFGMGYY